MASSLGAGKTQGTADREGAGSASGAVYAALVSASPDHQGDGMGWSNQATNDAHITPSLAHLQGHGLQPKASKMN